MIYLVRHAVAKSRGSWDGPDTLRPLTRKGERQARGLVGALDGRSIGRILSSPAVRCVATVEPLAAAVDTRVEEVADLYEETPVHKVLKIVADAARHQHDVVLCTHGDVIPDVLRALGNNGLRLRDEARWAKGSTWVLSGKGHRLTEARYIPPVEA